MSKFYYALKSAFNPLDEPDVQFLLHSDDASGIVGAKSGTGDLFTLGGGTIVGHQDSANPWTSDDDACYKTIAGATSPGNNGEYEISNIVGAGDVQHRNAARVAEAYSGTWSIPGRVTTLVDRMQGITFTQTGATTAKIPITVARRPGHKILSAGIDNSTRQWVEATHASAANFDLAPAFTLMFYGSIPSTVDAARDVFVIGNGGTNPTRYIRFNLSTTGLQLQINNGTNSSFAQAHAFATTFHVYGVTYNGADSATFYKDGVSLGTVSATHRALTGLTTYMLGKGAIGNDELHLGGAVGILGALDAPTMLIWSNWWHIQFQ